MRAKLFLLVPFICLSAMAQSNFSVETFPLEESSIDNGRGYWQEGIDRYPIKKECSRYSLEKAIASGDSIDDFVTRCESDMSKNSNISTLLAFLKVKFIPNQKKQYQTIRLHLGRGEVVSGILALKETKAPLPLMIIKAGTFANADITSSGKAVFMHYFQESPFHVLYLESTSGDHFMKVNRRAYLGGLAEGVHLVEAIEAMESSKFKERISEYHLGGISLGGSSVLFAGIYAERLQGRARPKSVTAICPVIDVEKTMGPLFGSFVTGTPLVPYFSRFLEDVWPYTENLQQTFPSIDFENLKAEDQMNIIKKGTVSYYGSLERGQLTSSIVDVVDVDEELYSFYNNYKNFYTMTKLPTYIIHAKDDSVVNYDINLGQFREQLQKEPNPYIHPVTFSEGNHCAYNQVYGTEYYSTLLRGIVLKHSEYKRKKIALDLGAIIENWKSPLFKIDRFKLWSGDVISRYNFIEITDDWRVKLQFRIFNESQRKSGDEDFKCQRFNYSNAPSDCFRTVSGYVNLKDLGIKYQGSDVGRNMVLRNLNTHAVILDSSGNEIIGAKEMPSLLLVSQWDY